MEFKFKAAGAADAAIENDRIQYPRSYNDDGCEYRSKINQRISHPTTRTQAYLDPAQLAQRYGSSQEEVGDQESIWGRNQKIRP